MKHVPHVPHLSRRAWLAGGAAVLLSGAAIGVASAQQSAQHDVFFYAGEANQQQYLDTLASKLGVSTDRLKQAMEETVKEVGLPAPPPLPGLPLPPGKGAMVRLSFSSELSAAAAAIKIGEDQLKQELPNRSLADVARAHGVDPQTVAQAIKAARLKDLDQAVKEGKVPAEIADKLKANLDNEVQLSLNAQHGADGSVRIQVFQRGTVPSSAE